MGAGTNQISATWGRGRCPPARKASKNKFASMPSRASVLTDIAMPGICGRGAQSAGGREAADPARPEHWGRQKKAARNVKPQTPRAPSIGERRLREILGRPQSPLLFVSVTSGTCATPAILRVATEPRGSWELWQQVPESTYKSPRLAGRGLPRVAPEPSTRAGACGLVVTSGATGLVDLW